MRYDKIDKIEMLSSDGRDYSCASSLTTLLDGYLGDCSPKTLEAVKVYKVGSLLHADGAKFWRCNAAGEPLNGAVLLFGDNGKPQEWLPITKTLWPFIGAQYALEEAFFGGHLLGMEHHKPVAVVADEVTALIGSQKYDKFTWIGIGHGANLTPSLLAQLSDRPAVLFPDSMSAEYWKPIAKDFDNVTVDESFTGSDINQYLANL